MDKERFLLKKIRTGNDYFLFNGNKGKILKVNSELYNNVSAILDENFMSGNCVSIYKSLHKSDILSDIYSTPYENVKDTFIDSIRNHHVQFTPESLYINNIDDINDINSLKKSILYYADNLSPSKLVTIEISGKLVASDSSALIAMVEFCSSLPGKFQFILHVLDWGFNKEIIPFIVFHDFYINIAKLDNKTVKKEDILRLEDSLHAIKEYDNLFFSRNVRISPILLKNKELSRLNKDNNFIYEDIKLLLNIRELTFNRDRSKKAGKNYYGEKMFISLKSTNLRMNSKKVISYNSFLALRGLARIHSINNRDILGEDNLFADNMSLTLHIDGSGKFFLNTPDQEMHEVGSLQSGILQDKLIATQKKLAAAKIENCYKCWVKNMCKYSVPDALQSLESDFCLQERIIWKKNLDLYSKLLSEYGYEKVNTIIDNFRRDYLLFSSI